MPELNFPWYLDEVLHHAKFMQSMVFNKEIRCSQKA